MVYPVTRPGVFPAGAEVFRTSVSGDGLSVDVGLAYCPSCGQELDAAWSFCQRCGTKLSDAMFAEFGRYRCVLVREGRPGAARVLPDRSTVAAGATGTVKYPLGRVSEDLNGGESRFGTGRDTYVTYRHEDGRAVPVNCPMGQRGFCGNGDTVCADLVGWLCIDDGDETCVCAGLCSARGGMPSERPVSAGSPALTRDDIMDVLSGTEGGVG